MSTETLGLMSEGRLSPRRQDAKAGNYYRRPDSAAVDRLHEQGCSIVNFADLIGILTGKFDGFVPSEVEIHKAN